MLSLDLGVTTLAEDIRWQGLSHSHKELSQQCFNRLSAHEPEQGHTTCLPPVAGKQSEAILGSISSKPDGRGQFPLSLTSLAVRDGADIWTQLGF